MCIVTVHRVTEGLHIGRVMYCITFIELLLFHASRGPTRRRAFTVIYIPTLQYWFLDVASEAQSAE